MKNIEKISEEDKFIITSDGKKVGDVVVTPWSGEQNEISGNFLPKGITTDSIEEIEKKIYEKAYKAGLEVRYH
jgi:hypothetical protein